MPQINDKYFPALDGLRALCVSFVIFDHLGMLPYPLYHVAGWLGVDIFFLISGFLITTLLLREERAKKKVDLIAFYVRRFFRIVPLYALVLTAYLIRAHRNPRQWLLVRHLMVYYLTMSMDILSAHIDVYKDYIAARTPPFGLTWSLGVEEKFYLLWPLLFFVILHKNTRRFAIPVLMAMAAFLPFRLFRSYFGLLVGCTLALLLVNTSMHRLRGWMERVPAVAILLLVAVGFYLVDLDVRFVFLFCLIGTALLAHLLLSTSWLVSLLSTKLFVWVGQRSYSMYLIHMAMIDAVEHFLPHNTVIEALLVTMCSIVVTALAAHVLHIFVEQPTRHLGKRLLARRGMTSSSVLPRSTQSA